MSAVKLNRITDPVFGNLVQLTNGKVDVRVTVDFGPRIIHCSCAGKENMFWQDQSKGRLGEKYDVFDDQLIIYGGHRLWISPEIVPRCYHPDNEPVTVTEVDDGATFTAAVEKHNMIQKSITVILESGRPRVLVTHTIENKGLWDVELALWCLSMMDKGGHEVMPMPCRETGLLPNRAFTFWEYSEMNDSRVRFGKKFITITQDVNKKNPFKLGYNNEGGWAAYFNKGQLFVKQFPTYEDGCYPDNGCTYETYTNSQMVEMETLGNLVQLAPGDAATHAEEWDLFEYEYKLTHDEDELEKILESFSEK
ncbi:MAG: DUF4380 domain-containing protein [Defluviitaleaceae bacterium]|nr:DUF4380 domain-containing protein [Defluviitaleaceae bacterium]